MKTSLPLMRWLVILLTVTGPLLIGLRAAQPPKKVLVVTVTTGFRHSCIPLSEQVIEQLARESGKFTVDFVRQPPGQPRAPRRPQAPKGGGTDAAHQEALRTFAEEQKAHAAAMEAWLPSVAAALQKLSPANLKNYHAVLFASTSGDLPLPDKQGFLNWIAAGNGFIGVHAATDTLHGFPPYIAMIGGEFERHGPQVTVDCINEDPAHAACLRLPKSWTVFDEIYEFKNFDRARVHGLLRLDKHPHNNAPGDFPIAWSKPHGKGRVFYTALGHREDVWDPNYTDSNGRKNPPEVARQFQQHLLGGILWALGLVPGEPTSKGAARR
jgi:uncharacterized protein